MKSDYRSLLFFSLCIALLAPLGFAQTTGSIEGIVTDQNGGTLPGVTVEATSPNLQGSRVATTAATAATGS
jgi:hypothetical protein